MQSITATPLGPQPRLGIQAAYLESDAEIETLLKDYEDAICGIFAYRLQYLRSSLALNRLPLTKERWQSPTIVGRLQFTIRTKIESRPAHDDEFTRITVTDYLLQKCPALADVHLCVCITSRHCTGVYEHHPADDARLTRVLANMDRVPRPGRA